MIFLLFLLYGYFHRDLSHNTPRSLTFAFLWPISPGLGIISALFLLYRLSERHPSGLCTYSVYLSDDHTLRVITPLQHIPFCSNSSIS